MHYILCFQFVLRLDWVCGRGGDGDEECFFLKQIQLLIEKYKRKQKRKKEGGDVFSLRG